MVHDQHDGTHVVWTGGSSVPWAAQYSPWLLIKLTPKGVIYSSHQTHVVWTGGSSGWQAPEQLIARSGGEARQGYSTDVFSYGMLLFYCLTAGKHPFGHHYERDFNILQVFLTLLALHRHWAVSPLSVLSGC